MPDTIIFDSLAFAKRGVDAGATPEVAEWLASEQTRLLESNLATKTDLERLENRLIKWFVAALFLSAGLVVAGVGIVVQVLLSGIPS